MTVTDVHADTEALTLTVRATFDAEPDRVWLLWADPRQLERWWGPPTYPASVDVHELVVGGSVTYAMTGPEGDRHHGWWRVLEVDTDRLLVVDDGFADDSGVPNPDLPVTRMRVELTARSGGGTDVTITSSFDTAEQLQQLLDMGMLDGLRAAMGQMDDVLAA